MALSFRLNTEEEDFLGKQAVLAIQTVLNEDPGALPLTPPGNWQGGDGKPESPLMKLHGVFVTLKRDGKLRGCMGTVTGNSPLYLNIWDIARSAAFSDPRFPALTKAEWPTTSLEISVLSEPVVVKDIKNIKIGDDGLILSYNGKSGVFLPQVPVENNWNLDQYLDQLCLKAGVPAGSWKNDGAVISSFEAQAFPVK